MRNYLNVRGKLLDCSTPVVMGILNLTPDSFFDGGRYGNEKEMLRHVGKMLEDGAAIVDVGAQSTRPGAIAINAEEEWGRLSPSLSMIRKTFPDAVFSVDTFHSAVAERAVNSGADIINDVSGGSLDEKMFETAGRLRVPYVLMHMQGTPMTMQQNPVYANVTEEVMDYFTHRINRLLVCGVQDLILDPGFGFGKTTEHNLELLSRLSLFRWAGWPVLVGVSRKSMVNKILGTSPATALNGTTVLHTIALQNGAGILRVHDVREAVEAIQLWKAMNGLLKSP